MPASTSEVRIGDQTGTVIVTLNQNVLTVSGPKDFITAIHRSIVYGIATWDESELTG